MIKLVGVVARGRRTGVLVVHRVWAPLAERSRRREEILLLSLYCVRLVSECCNSSFVAIGERAVRLADNSR